MNYEGEIVEKERDELEEFDEHLTLEVKERVQGVATNSAESTTGGGQIRLAHLYSFRALCTTVLCFGNMPLGFN